MGTTTTVSAMSRSTIDDTPLARFLVGPDVTRPCPDAAALHPYRTAHPTQARRRRNNRRKRLRSSEPLPASLIPLASLRQLGSWDLTHAHLVDQHTGTVLLPAVPAGQDPQRQRPAPKLAACHDRAHRRVAAGARHGAAAGAADRPADGDRAAARLPPQGRRRDAREQKSCSRYTAVARLKPRLLVLDPFVRLHRIDENASGEVAPLLAFLRDLRPPRRRRRARPPCQERRGHSPRRPALRSSSEFHAWGESNLYLRRDGEERIILTAEHRAASAIPSITLALNQRTDALAFEPVEPHDLPAPDPATTSIDERTAALAEADQPRPFAELRARRCVRSATL